MFTDIPEHVESNKSDWNRTGDLMGRLVSLNSIPPTWRSFVVFFYSNYSVRSINKAKFTLIYFISELSRFMGIERYLILSQFY